jgi:hypothetical protein
VAQADTLGTTITSGGGFSTSYPRPSWQEKAVTGYFAAAAAAGQSPPAGYATNGRGYPDISLAGLSYDVVVGGKLLSVSGTSASCPAVAGFISTINAARIAKGKGSVGFLNPALYAYGSSFTNDITSGNIFCAGDDGTCCPQGFYAAPGWDPTTGFGSVNYGKMASVLVALGSTAVPTSSPVSVPAALPVSTPVAAPVAEGTLLTGYFVEASYSDSACSALRNSFSDLLNSCYMNSDLTSTKVAATATEVLTMQYTDSACESTPVVTRESYTGLCTGSKKSFVRAEYEVQSTVPTVFHRSVHPISFHLMSSNAIAIHPILSYHILSCPIVSYLILSHPILSYPIISCFFTYKMYSLKSLCVEDDLL